MLQRDPTYLERRFGRTRDIADVDQRESADLQVCWRRGRESNPSRRLCRPLHNRFATSPEET